jgi:hypothetical protein
MIDGFTYSLTWFQAHVNPHLIQTSIHMCLASWGGHFPPNVVGGLYCLALGTLLYNQHNTKSTQHKNQHITTQHNTTRTHNTQHTTTQDVPPPPSPLAGGPRLAKKRITQPRVGIRGGGALKERCDLGGTCGGTPYCCLVVKISNGLKRPPLGQKTQQSTDS